ncbi:hypothetical protein Trisim1_012510 [Trichoderma cf. simile WF8]
MHLTQDLPPIMRNDDDEWRGTTDPGVRRRVQNRLNQRAYRQRRQMLGILDKPPKKATRIPVSQHLNHTDKRRSGLVPTGAESLRCRRQAEDKSHVTGRLEARHRTFDDKHFASTSASVDPSLWYTNPAAVVFFIYMFSSYHTALPNTKKPRANSSAEIHSASPMD